MPDLSLPVSSSVGNAASDAIEELPVSYVEVDATGLITRSNRAARALHSAENAEIAGKYVWEFSPDGSMEVDRARFLATMSSGEMPPVVRRSLYSNGEFRSYDLHRTLIRDAAGRPVGVRAVTFDVTEAQIAHEKAHKARMWLESVLDSMSEAIVITDSLGFIRAVNPATEVQFGWQAAELEGKVVEKAFPLLAYSAESGVKLSFNMALQSRSRGIATLLDRHRRELQVEISTSPILDKSTGFTIGVVSVMQPIDEASRPVPVPQPDQP
ncbi:MAG: PAS domain-containing protein [Terracidiphilus sp.]